MCRTGWILSRRGRCRGRGRARWRADGWRLWVGRTMVTGTFRHILSIHATRIRSSNLSIITRIRHSDLAMLREAVVLLMLSHCKYCFQPILIVRNIHIHTLIIDGFDSHANHLHMFKIFLLKVKGQNKIQREKWRFSRLTRKMLISKTFPNRTKPLNVRTLDTIVTVLRIRQLKLWPLTWEEPSSELSAGDLICCHLGPSPLHLQSVASSYEWRKWCLGEIQFNYFAHR